MTKRKPLKGMVAVRNTINQGGLAKGHGIGQCRKILDSVEKFGWNEYELNIGYHASRGATDMTIGMDRLRAILGTSVLYWERQPGRTESDVLELLRKAVAR